MSNLFLWCVFQVMLFSLGGILFHLLLTRIFRRGSTIAPMVTCWGILILSIVSLLPFPSWNPFPIQSASTPVPEEVHSFAPGISPEQEIGLEQPFGQRPDLIGEAPLGESLLEKVRGIWGSLGTAAPYPVEPVASKEQVSGWSWEFYFFGLIAALIGLGLVRFLVGWWLVRKQVQGAIRIDEPALSEKIDILSAEFSVKKRVEVKETAELLTAATVGYRRPIILLPREWRSWSDEELHTVLAHEMAHVALGHFQDWVTAQIALVLHFYQPLVHRICRLLRTEQEIEADALAARVSGGRLSYLENLAALTFRQIDRKPAWPVRAFLPSRDTLLRRIQMLRQVTEYRLAPFGTRVLLASTLVASALILAGFRPVTAQQDQTDPTTESTVAQGESGFGNSKAPEERLSHIPRNSTVVVSIQPQLILQQIKKDEDLGRIYGMFSKGNAELIELTKIVEGISQLTIVSPSVESGVSAIVTYRTPEEAVTANKMINGGTPEEVSFAGVKYYRMGPMQSYYPVSPTRVIYGNDRCVQELIISGSRIRSELVKSAEFTELHSKHPIAIAVDLMDLELLLAREFRNQEMSIVSPIFEHTESLMLGFALEEGNLKATATLKCDSAEGAQEVAETIQGGAVLFRNLLRGMAKASQISQESGPDSRMTKTILSVLKTLTIAKSEKVPEIRLTAQWEFDPISITSLMDLSSMAIVNSSRAVELNHLKQLGLAMHNYHEVYGYFPPAVIVDPVSGAKRSWRVELLPYIEQEGLYRQYRMDEPWDSENNKRVLEQIPEIYKKKNAKEGETNTSIMGVVAPGMMFDPEKKVYVADCHDGLSNTIALVNNPKGDVPWTKPNDFVIDGKANEITPKHLEGFLQGDFPALRADGSVGWVAKNPQPTQLLNHFLRADGNVAQSIWDEPRPGPARGIEFNHPGDEPASKKAVDPAEAPATKKVFEIPEEIPTKAKRDFSKEAIEPETKREE